MMFKKILYTAFSMCFSIPLSHSMENNGETLRVCPDSWTIMPSVLAASHQVGHKFLDDKGQWWVIVESEDLFKAKNSSGRLEKTLLSNSKSNKDPKNQTCFYNLHPIAYDDQQNMTGGHVIIAPVAEHSDTQR